MYNKRLAFSLVRRKKLLRLKQSYSKHKLNKYFRIQDMIYKQIKQININYNIKIKTNYFLELKNSNKNQKKVW